MMQPGPAAPSGGGIRAFLRRAGDEPSGLLGAAVVGAVCAAGSAVLWGPLGAPSEIVRGIVPVGNCTGFTPGSPLMYVCSMKVALLSLTGPIALLVLAFVFRRALGALVEGLKPRLPAEASFLVAPVLATVLFTMSWAGAHATTGGLSGILPQTVFPGVVGVFTYGVARWGRLIQRAARPIFDLRDRVSTRVRLVLVVAIPMLVSFSLTAEQRVSNTAFKEQVVVLVGLAVGFLILAPRQGDLMGGLGQQVSGLARQAAPRQGRR